MYFAPQYSAEKANSIVAALSLSNMFANVTLLSLLVGMAAAVETLGSQYNGAHNYHQVGLTLQRSVLILTYMAVSLVPFWLYSKTLFSSMGVDNEVCEMISVLLHIRVLSIPADIIRESYEAYIISLGVMGPPMYGAFASDATLCVCNFAFASVLQFQDYKCLGYSFLISAYVGLFVQIHTSIDSVPVRRTLLPFSASALEGWQELIDLGIPSIIQICSEW
jgi:Na+-driven multidrug efflux pump